MSSQTILVTIATNSQEQKVQEKVFSFIDGLPDLKMDQVPLNILDLKLSTSKLYKDHKGMFDSMGGRAYKPFLIERELGKLKMGDFLIYCDLDPKVWSRLGSLALTTNGMEILKNLCVKSSGLLVPLARWSDGPFMSEHDMGKATHRNFTSPYVMTKMKMNYPDSYLPSGSPWIVKKSKGSVQFVEEWLRWNSDEDLFLPGELGFGFDQSFAGLIMADLKMRMIFPLSGGLGHPSNFIYYTSPELKYRFIEAR